MTEFIAEGDAHNWVALRAQLGDARTLRVQSYNKEVTPVWRPSKCLT